MGSAMKSSSSSSAGLKGALQGSSSSAAVHQVSPAPEPSHSIKFLSAGLAGCTAEAATFPLDVAKVRLQIQGEGTAGTNTALPPGEKVPSGGKFKYRGVLGTIKTISKEEGVRSLYKGLAPGLQRQVAFCSVRIGLYDPVKHLYMRHAGGSNSGDSVILRLLAGMTTGGLAVSVAQPTDVVKVRMQASAGKPLYKNSMDAYRTIANTEGVKGLYKGLLPNIARNSIVNACELVSYEMFKMKLLSHGLMQDNIACHFTAGVGAGLVTTITASPVDVVKTRFMNSGHGVYRGAIHCAVLMAKEGGFSAFYKGVVPSFMRITSWSIVMFICFEQLKRTFRTFSESEDDDSDTFIHSYISVHTGSAHRDYHHHPPHAPDHEI